jgi:LPPG:FO 2-phospho-L-lactate transferase
MRAGASEMNELNSPLKITALAGGVGGAKLADGLAQVLGKNLTVIVNTGDDFDYYGLKICPDLDTVCYTLAGLANPETGWGRKDETWRVLNTLESLGGPAWFRLGDRDLATHLERTRRLLAGQTLSQVISDFKITWGISACVLPMTDETVSTIVESDEGELAFQEYFVKRKCEPRVKGFIFKGALDAQPAPGVIEALQEADFVILCPSNPWVSIDPILSVRGIREALEKKTLLAVSPIIGGQAVKGPVVKMFSELGFQPSAAAVARHYEAKANGGLLDGFIIDSVDADLLPEIEDSGFLGFVTGTVMNSPHDRRRMAEEALEFGWSLIDKR